VPDSKHEPSKVSIFNVQWVLGKVICTFYSSDESLPANCREYIEAKIKRRLSWKWCFLCTIYEKIFSHV